MLLLMLLTLTIAVVASIAFPPPKVKESEKQHRVADGIAKTSARGYPTTPTASGGAAGVPAMTPPGPPPLASHGQIGGPPVAGAGQQHPWQVAGAPPGGSLTLRPRPGPITN